MIAEELYGDEIFTQSLGSEADRLRAIADTYDHVSRRQIRQLRLPPTSRCLDAGAGSGSIADWLARTFPAGHVTAADRDTRMLEAVARGRDNLHAVQGDLSADFLDPTHRFDLVHARFLLMHLRERDAVLQRLADLVEPGGWIMVSDSVDLTTPALLDTPYGQVMNTMWTVLHTTIGTDITRVTTTPALLAGHGFTDLSVEVHLPSADRHSPVARFWHLTWEQMRERLLATGALDAATLDRALADLGADGFARLSPGMITTRARRPA
ncbi:methyltransferase domain-containing protein [Kitasatospora sp. NPDC096128]|uniref:methyltransferase domain-containing protein n=1 Tax=Kitasatospora sp. NPDC096128 TaxID=3155547 RepID=UPI00332A875F